MEDQKEENKIEMQLPVHPPHVVAGKLAEEAMKEGYFIGSIQLVYYTNGEQIVSNIVPNIRQKDN